MSLPFVQCLFSTLFSLAFKLITYVSFTLLQQQRDYAVSWWQMQNALMMKEVALLRTSLMRQQAHMFDWFVQ
jgi:hypothetical protein